ncbi:PriA Primosomal protein N' (replication factor Y) - superfamily II helicase [Oxalobacteraceae bacterium]
MRCKKLFCSHVHNTILQIALDTPLDTTFDYRYVASTENIEKPLIGQFVRVPFGKREVAGLIVGVNKTSDIDPQKIRDVIELRHQITALSSHWMQLCEFAAEYYQRPFGEVALPAVPKALREGKVASIERALKKISGPTKPKDEAGNEKSKTTDNANTANTANTSETTHHVTHTLNEQQQQAVDSIAATTDYACHLLFGITGSGKTQVYLQAAKALLEKTKASGQRAQILILVPEINLTPQLENQVRASFPRLNVVSMHSQLSEGERLRNWLAAHEGHADIVLGTRLAVLASMPHLKLIIVDEEHDPSYKQQEGLRYSARDLAIWRARQLAIPVVLGSATPSIESWQHAETGRYKRLTLTQRASAQATVPRVGLIDMERDKAVEGLCPSLLTALRERLARGEQSLLFLNRRGYAPVMHCDACGWISNCRRCTAFMVLHKPERRLRCHHCSLELRVPQSCPTCGNVDIQPLGRGTQRVEEHLHTLFPDARILRIDADSTRRKGSAQEAFDSVHRGEVDILLGTQMVAKGHDFQRLTLVGVINPDTALFSQDYRASERLFAQLMQVAGRAGRAASELGSVSEVLVQTRYPQHPLYRALMNQDYTGFAASVLEERQSAGLPPFVFQALLRAEAKTLDKALEFLTAAKTLLEHEGIIINDPVPMTITRVAGVERAQLLLESSSRAVLQAFLKPWMQALRESKSRLRWSLEVDPVDI